MPCAICTDRFDSVLDIARTKCGHVFHSDCVSKWVAHSRTCPECRGSVFLSDLLDLLINFASNADAVRLKRHMSEVKREFDAKNEAVIYAKDKIKELQLHLIFKNLDISKTQEHIKGLELEYALVRAKVGLRSLPSLVSEVQRLKQENRRLTEELNSIQTMKSSQKDEVPPMKKRRVESDEEVEGKSTSSVNPSKLSTSSVQSSPAAKNVIQPADSCNHHGGKCACQPSTISEK
ncbi:e3 ubiquitin-protein ligase TRAIP [Trichonephila inaurata madagascariensis]|uniref:E3 ubiquitin-protein ligase TRAIP n=1 Tax=Trichonephila inaurata madagascariensis TaxID=2747483 RepID=A0A8X7CLN0_9ARAC|nr:e3 ubiquitin-protein ligase TRAIP [Trichonephila inaurata madagascariensis]